MASYMIHTCPQRLWYVNDFLIPSMLEQGVEREQIKLWNDEKMVGCLESCMKAFESCGKRSDEGVWHMQDDVVISSDFKEMTEKHDDGIVCGHLFGLHRDMDHHIGIVTPQQMWFSFPCIRIPNRIAAGCSEWFYDVASKDEQFQDKIRAKRYDDTFFNIYVQWFQQNAKITNLVPNIVAHIDYLIGGSVAQDSTTAPEIYFTDIDAIENLKRKLAER